MAKFKHTGAVRPEVMVPTPGRTIYLTFDGNGDLDTLERAAALVVPFEELDAAVRAHPDFGTTIEEVGAADAKAKKGRAKGESAPPADPTP
jgi:hypothetical protein